MSEPVERVKRCAIQVSKELHYDIDETEPTIMVTRPPLERIQFSAFLDIHLQKFALKDTEKTKDPDVKILLDTLNRHLEKCLKKKHV
jgi:hypothetical protein